MPVAAAAVSTAIGVLVPLWLVCAIASPTSRRAIKAGARGAWGILFRPFALMGCAAVLVVGLLAWLLTGVVIVALVAVSPVMAAVDAGMWWLDRRRKPVA